MGVIQLVEWFVAQDTRFTQVFCFSLLSLGLVPPPLPKNHSHLLTEKLLLKNTLIPQPRAIREGLVR